MRLSMQYSLCHQLKQLNRVFKAEEDEGDRRREGERETESRQRQRKEALTPNTQHNSLAQCRTPLLMKEEMNTRDEGGRRKRRKILVLSRLLLSHYASFCFYHSRSVSLSVCVCVCACKGCCDLHEEQRRERKLWQETCLLSFLEKKKTELAL